MKKEKKNKKKAQDEVMFSNKEREILDYYSDEEYVFDEDVEEFKDKVEDMEEYDYNDEDYEEFEEVEEVEEPKNKKNKKEKKQKPKKEKIEEYVIDDDLPKTKKEKVHDPMKTKINIFFSIIIVIISLITIDIISVAKYENGPFFAIPLHTFKDGGSKSYYGLGYKVIKYNAKNGKKGMEIGTWLLKYDIKPVETNIIDLAIEFTNEEQFSYEKYMNEFMKVTGNLENVSEKQNTITISYRDNEGDKYTLLMVCNMADKDVFKTLSTDQTITIVGTINKYKSKTKNKPATLYVRDCYVVE